MAYNIKAKLEKNGFKNVTAIDAGSLSLNKQHNVSEFLKHNLSVEEIKETQKASIDMARRNFITKIGIPNWQKKFYEVNKGDENIRISDTIKKSNNSGIVLSSVANDLMTQAWVNPISYAIARLPFTDSSAKERARILLTHPQFRSNVTEGLKRNIEQILGLNEKAKICILGIYKPKILPEKYDLLNNYLTILNFEIQKIARNYHQSYININDTKSKIIDFHPTKESFEAICKEIADRLISRFEYNKNSINVNRFEYDTSGLIGVHRDLIDLQISEKESVEKTIEMLVKEKFEGYSEESIREIMKACTEGRQNEILEHAQIYCDADENIVNRKLTLK